MLKPVPRPSLTTLTTTLGKYIPSVATLETVGPEESGAAEEAKVADPEPEDVTDPMDYCSVDAPVYTDDGDYQCAGGAHVAYVAEPLPRRMSISGGFSNPFLCATSVLTSGPLTSVLRRSGW